MSQTNDYSKRLFADFIAARLSARGIARDTTRQASQATVPPAKEDPEGQIEQRGLPLQRDAADQPRSPSSRRIRIIEPRSFPCPE
jgi:hypothetical protein